MKGNIFLCLSFMAQLLNNTFSSIPLCPLLDLFHFLHWLLWFPYDAFPFSHPFPWQLDFFSSLVRIPWLDQVRFFLPFLLSQESNWFALLLLKPYYFLWFPWTFFSLKIKFFPRDTASSWNLLSKLFFSLVGFLPSIFRIRHSPSIYIQSLSRDTLPYSQA